MSAQPWFLRPPNNLHVAESRALARLAARQFVECIRERLEAHSDAVVAPSAGRTPRQTYAILRERYRTAVDWSRVVCVQMDEYSGLGSRDPRSFAGQLLRELVEPLRIGRFISFYDRNGRARFSIDEYETKVRMLGGIDCALHGVGRNGHIALNEPRATSVQATRKVRLDASTRLANDVSFRCGVTLGMRVLGEARTSIVMLLGDQKRDAANALLFGAPSSRNPAAYLRRCRSVSIYMDPAAAPRARAGCRPYAPGPIRLA